jgi:hypothetical protein
MLEAIEPLDECRCKRGDLRLVIDDEGRVDKRECHDSEKRFERDDGDGATSERRGRTECEKGDRNDRKQDAHEDEWVAWNLSNSRDRRYESHHDEPAFRPTPLPRSRNQQGYRTRGHHPRIVPRERKIERGEGPIPEEACGPLRGPARDPTADAPKEEAKKDGDCENR